MPLGEHIVDLIQEVHDEVDRRFEGRLEPDPVLCRALIADKVGQVLMVDDDQEIVIALIAACCEVVDGVVRGNGNRPCAIRLGTSNIRPVYPRDVRFLCPWPSLRMPG